MSTKQVYVWLLSLLACLMMTAALATSEGSGQNSFSIESANKQLEVFTALLANEKSDDTTLHQAMITVKDLQDKASNCATQGMDVIKKIDQLLNNGDIGKAIESNKGEYSYLTNKKNTIAAKVAACRVFMFKSDEIMGTYSDSIKKHLVETPEKIRPIWRVISYNLFSQFTVSTEQFYQNIGVDVFTPHAIYILVFLLALSLFISHQIRKACQTYMQAHVNNQWIIFHFISIIFRYAMYLLPLLTACAYMKYLFNDADPISVIESFTYGTTLFIASIAFLDFILHLPTKNKNNIIKNNQYNAVFNLSVLVISFIFIGYISVVLLKGIELTESVVALIKASYITLLLLSFLGLVFSILNLPSIRNRYLNGFNTALKTLATICFAALIAAEWFGYAYISVYIMQSVFLTALIILVSWGAVKIIDRAFMLIENNRYTTSHYIRSITNANPDKQFIELHVFRLALYITMMYLITIATLNAWNASIYYIDLVKAGFSDGFVIMGIKIIPVYVISGLITFSIINIFGRLYANHVAEKDISRSGRRAQVAVASVINYVSFAIAFIAGLFIAGVDFTGLAIIAGALSVGIGFGMQNVINNFICGLILLIQKPVKAGDRVIVGETEGFIRRITLISTQIKTLSKEDVIIPNSTLISTPVTNFMYSDRLWRVCSSVGVSYGTDTALVEKLLLGVAHKHPDVIKDEPDEPIVFFLSFGDSSLQFELWCVIKDVNKKYRVRSELNHAIDLVFKENNIIIPFPQRDLHIINPIKPEKPDEGNA